MSKVQKTLAEQLSFLSEHIVNQGLFADELTLQMTLSKSNLDVIVCLRYEDDDFDTLQIFGELGFDEIFSDKLEEYLAEYLDSQDDEYRYVPVDTFLGLMESSEIEISEYTITR